MYQIVSTFPASSIHLISNRFDYAAKLDPRIKSRLTLSGLEFKPYSADEIYKILTERVKIALRKDSFPPPLLKQIANITFNKGDLRIGLHLLRESSKIAEKSGKIKIDKEHVKKAIETVLDRKPEEEQLNKDENLILEIVKKNNGGISGKLFESYQKVGGELSYKSFKRYIKNLERHGILKSELTAGGFKGKSTRISLNK